MNICLLAFTVYTNPKRGTGEGVCISIYVCIYIYIYIYVYAYIHIYIHFYRSINQSIYLYMYVYIEIYAYAYIYVYLKDTLSPRLFIIECRLVPVMWPFKESSIPTISGSNLEPLEATTTIEVHGTW